MRSPLDRLPEDWDEEPEDTVVVLLGQTLRLFFILAGTVGIVCGIFAAIAYFR